MRLQQHEFELEGLGSSATRHQREVGTGVVGTIAQAISAGQASIPALADSTERHRFSAPWGVLPTQSAGCKPADSGQTPGPHDPVNTPNPMNTHDLMEGGHKQEEVTSKTGRPSSCSPLCEAIET